MPPDAGVKHPLILGLIGFAVVSFFLGYLQNYHEEVLTPLGLGPVGGGRPRNAFNPATLQWLRATSTVPWQARDAHALVAFRDKLWLLGGLNGDGFVRGKGVEYWKAPHFAEVWLSADGSSWELVTAKAPWGERRSAEVEIFKNNLWLIGGWVKSRGYHSDVWFSEDGLSWAEATSSLPRWLAREGHSVVVFKDKLWLAGGVNFDGRETLNDVWYSDDGVNWNFALAESPWRARYDHTLIVFKNRLWLIGGVALGGHIFSDIWVSDDGLNWQLVSEIFPWPARHGHRALTFKDKLWIIGGWNTENGGLNDTWYSEDGKEWREVGKDAPWPGREDHAAAVFKDKIWIAGGMDKDWHWQNDVWVSDF